MPYLVKIFWTLAVALVASVYASSATDDVAARQQSWSGWGGNMYNNRWATSNNAIDSNTVADLSLSCKMTYDGGVSATPVIVGAITYFPTWNGLFVALNYHTCTIQWQINVSSIITDYAPLSSDQQTVLFSGSRTSPQIDGDVLYFGTLANALVIAINRHTGNMLGRIQINPHPMAMLTMSPTLYEGKLYIGAASFEELAVDVVPNYPCCSFVGNMVALQFSEAQSKFSVLWNVSMLPSNHTGWSGVAIWGSQPSIDESRRQVFIATGNVYTIPPDFVLCQNQSQQVTVIAQGLTSDPCLPPYVYEDSVIAIDLDTGFINWVTQVSPLDGWTLACGIYPNEKSNPNCPYQPGPDADFGMAPTFIPGSVNTPYGRDIVVIGQKNGILHALSAQAGRRLWSTITSPTGISGGLIWGIAADAQQVYFTAVNYAQLNFTLQPSGKVIHSSAVGAIRLVDGTIAWEVQIRPDSSLSFVPPTVVNDVVLVGRSNIGGVQNQVNGTNGMLMMLDKNTGATIRNMNVGALFRGGVAVQDKYVLFGTGYKGYTSTKGALRVLSV